MHAYRLSSAIIALLTCGSLAFNSGCGSSEPDDLGEWGIAIEDLEALPPDVVFTAEAHDPDSDLSVRFTAEAIDGTTLAPDSVTWTFGDGGMTTGTTVFHTYVTEGDYVVQAQASYQQTATAKTKNFVVHVRRFKVQVSAQPSQGQVPLGTQLNGQVVVPTGHSAETYLWDFGDGETAEGSLEVTHTFVEPGQYPVELTVITNRGWQRTGRISVEGLLDNLPPQAVIQADPLSGLAPITVLFDGSQSSDPDGDPIISHDWEFGDGQTAEGEAAEHIYQVRGDYQAKLTVTDARGGSSTAEVTVAVDGPNQAPTACIEAVPTSGTAPLQVTFRAQCSSDDDGSIQSYNWDFGDGVSTGGIEQTHTYQGPGDYTATLMVIDNEGGTDSVAVTIHVNDAPSASFVVTPEDSVAPTVVHFDASASGDADGTIASYRWEFGDGQALEGAGWEQAQHTYASGGSYVVRLTVIDDEGASASVERSVWLAELVVQPASIDFGDSGSDETLQISNTGGAGLAYNVSIDYGGGPGGWLAVNPVSGTCPAGQTSTMTVTDSRDLLAPGSHSAVINVTASSVTKAVGVSIAVVAVATSVDSHDFGAGSTPFQLQVWNGGTGTLEFHVASKPDWLEVNTAGNTSTGPGDPKTATLTVDRTELEPGAHDGDLVIMPRSDQGPHGKTVAVSMIVEEQPGMLSVIPQEGLTSTGLEGGPFSPSSKVYTLSNTGDASIDWTASKTANWITLSKTGGTLAGAQSDILTVSINSNANSLAADDYGDTVSFNNITNSLGGGPLSVLLTVNERVPGTLSVTPADGLTSGGVEGGPFSPSSKIYTLSNTGDSSIDWTASKTATWITLSKAGGTLAAGESDTLAISINTNADGLPVDNHSDTVTLTNATNGRGDTPRPVSLTVSSGSAQPMHTASRTSGVAPLGVFFDAVDVDGWDSGVVQPADGDYASFHYKWDFGDPESGTWSAGRRNPDGSYPSKNKATGYISAHVFENPGTYTVTLAVLDTNDQTHEYQQEIDVQAFSGTTYYVSSSEGSDSNDGLSPAAPFATFGKAMSMIATNTRILFKRGDTWAITTGVVLPADGPGLIGAYGTGDRPKFMVTTNTIPFHLGYKQDWRLVDLDIEGAYPNPCGSGIRGTEANCLILRCRVSKCNDGLVTGTVNSPTFVSECEMLNNKAYGVYMGTSDGQMPRVALLGCDFDNAIESHLLRTYTSKMLIGQCNFKRAHGHFIKMVALMAPHSAKYNIVSDNHFGETGESIWLVSIGPVDSRETTRQLVEHVLIERNTWDVSHETSGKVHIQSRGANHITIRNNRFIEGAICIQANNAPPDFSTWTDWKIYNNSYYSSADQWARFIYASSDSVVHSWDIRNNAVSIPTTADISTYFIVAQATSVDQFVCDNNNWHLPNKEDWFLVGGSYETYTFTQWQALGKGTRSYTGDPLFVDPENSDLHLQADSPGRNAGVNLAHAREDYDGRTRPSELDTDMGACEYAP